MISGTDFNTSMNNMNNNLRSQIELAINDFFDAVPEIKTIAWVQFFDKKDGLHRDPVVGSFLSISDLGDSIHENMHEWSDIYTRPFKQPWMDGDTLKNLTRAYEKRCVVYASLTRMTEIFEEIEDLNRIFDNADEDIFSLVYGSDKLVVYNRSGQIVDI